MNNGKYNQTLTVSSYGQQPTNFIIVLPTPLEIPPNSEIAWVNMKADLVDVVSNTNTPAVEDAVVFHGVKGFGAEFGDTVNFGIKQGLINGNNLNNAGIFHYSSALDINATVNPAPIYYPLYNDKKLIITKLEFRLYGYTGQPIVQTANEILLTESIINYTFNIRRPQHAFLQDFVESLNKRWEDQLILMGNKEEIDLTNHN